MQVHDELVLEVRADCVEQAAARSQRTHERRGANWRVPLKVEVGSGLNWDEAH